MAARRIGAGGPFLRQISTGTQAAEFEDDSWWGGATLCFASIAIAATAAIVPASARAQAIHQQNEEIFPSARGVSDIGISAPPTQRAKVSPLFIKWDQPDELPIAATFVPSDDDPSLAQTLVSLQPSANFIVWATSDEVITSIPDEDFWDQPRPLAPKPFAQPWLADDEIVPQAAQFVAPEDDWLLPFPRPVAPISQVWQDVDAFESFALAEDDWQCPGAPPARIFLQSWTDGDIPFLPLTVTEEDWQPPPAAVPGARAPQLFDDGAIAFAAALIIAEEDWQPPVPPAPKAWLQAWVDSDFIGTPPTPIVEDEGWQPPVFKPFTVVSQWSEPDELPRIFNPEDDWRQPQPALVKPFAQAWTDDDFIAPVPLHVVEEDWIPPTPAPLPAVVRIWHDDIKGFPPPANISGDEEQWQVLTPKPVAPFVALWLWQDDLATAAAQPFVSIGGNERVGAKKASSDARIGSKSTSGGARIGSKSTTANRRIGSKKG